MDSGNQRTNKHVTRACDECRRAKTKCDGNNPCSRCAERQSECVFPLTTDGRSQHGDMKRKLAALEEESSILRAIVSHIRDTQDEHVSTVIAIIRSNASISEVYQSIQHHVEVERASGRQPSPLLNDLSTQIVHAVQHQNLAGPRFSEHTPRRNLFNVSRLIDNSPVEGSSQPSAKVVENDGQANGRLHKPNPNTTSERSLNATRSQHPVMSITSLCDIPVINVPAQPWTSVTEDDAFVSHLVSLYFTWHNPYFSCLDEKIFTDAVRSKDTSSLLCSPCLVNAVLFMGCMYSDNPLVFATPDDPASRGVHFMEEALRLWALEEGKVTLVNLQILLILTVGLMFNGKDRISMLYLRQSVDLSAELTRKVKKSLKQASDAYLSTEFQRSLSCAVWGGFVSQVGLGLAWMKSMDAKSPQISRPYSGPELRDRVYWKPYPDPGSEVATLYLTVLDELFTLHEMGLELIPLLLSGNAVDTPNSDHEILDKSSRLARAQELSRRLEEWHHDLPSRIGFTDKPSTISPTEMDLLLTYHAWRIMLANLTLSITTDVEEEGALSDASFLTDRTLRIEARTQVISSTKAIATHTDQFRAVFGRRNFSIYMTQASMTAIWSVMDVLHEPEMPNVFHSMLVTVSITARRALICRGFSRMILVTLQQRGLESLLSEASRKLLRLNAVENWGPKDHEVFQSVTYPNVVVAREEGRILADMGDLLEKRAKMDLEEGSGR